MGKRTEAATIDPHGSGWLRGEATMVHWFTVVGSCALGLGVALVQPGWSESQEPTRQQVDTTTQRSDRNWHAFWRHHLGEWRGQWTRYSPSGDVRESFASTRRFTADPGRTAGMQTNRYRYGDGRSIEKTWSYTLQNHSLADGFAHPAGGRMRGLALDNGAAAWLIPTLQPHEVAPFELFLKRGDSRHSVGVIYGADGTLQRTASIRETRGNQSETIWTNNVEHGEPWHPIGRWQGVTRQLHADLTLGPVQRSEWQWVNTDQTTHFFPDGIILRCPDQRIPGQSFAIEVIWRLNAGELQTITAQYDNKAHLVAITHQSLTPQMESPES